MEEDELMVVGEEDDGSGAGAGSGGLERHAMEIKEVIE